MTGNTSKDFQNMEMNRAKKNFVVQNKLKVPRTLAFLALGLLDNFKLASVESSEGGER
jgi:hypothetical protein